MSSSHLEYTVIRELELFFKGIKLKPAETWKSTILFEYGKKYHLDLTPLAGFIMASSTLAAITLDEELEFHQLTALLLIPRQLGGCPVS